MVWGLGLVIRNEEARAVHGRYGLSIGVFSSTKAGKIMTLLNYLKFCFDVRFHQLEIEDVATNVVMDLNQRV